MVKKTGQQWTHADKLRLTNRNSIKFKEAGTPSASASTALRHRTADLVPGGRPKVNVLVGLPAAAGIEARGLMADPGPYGRRPRAAFAISHPHYYSSMVRMEAGAFGGGADLPPRRRHASG